MILKNVVFPLLVVFMLTLGQIGFKSVGTKIRDGVTLNILWDIRVEILGVLFLYGFATLLWVYVLSYMPLSKAFSYYAIVFIIVPILSSIFFGEEVLNWQFILGTVLIITGVLITVKI